MSALIYRDTFARVELHRRKFRGFQDTCSWCGSKRKHGLFQYYHEHDGAFSNRRGYVNGAFCSVGCMRAYNT